MKFTIFSSIFGGLFFSIFVIYFSTLMVVKFHSKDTFSNSLSKTSIIISDIFQTYNRDLIKYTISIIISIGVLYFINLYTYYYIYYDGSYNLFDYMNWSIESRFQNGFDLFFYRLIPSNIAFYIIIYVIGLIFVPYILKFAVYIAPNHSSHEEIKLLNLTSWFLIFFIGSATFFDFPTQASKTVAHKEIFAKATKAFHKKELFYLVDSDDNYVYKAITNEAKTYIIPKYKKNYTVDLIKQNAIDSRNFSPFLMTEICNKIIKPQNSQTEFSKNTKYFYEMKKIYCQPDKKD